MQLEPIGEEIECESCRLMLLQRIQDVVISWSSVKVRLPLLPTPPSRLIPFPHPFVDGVCVTIRPRYDPRFVQDAGWSENIVSRIGCMFIDLVLCPSGPLLRYPLAQAPPQPCREDVTLISGLGRYVSY